MGFLEQLKRDFEEFDRQLSNINIAYDKNDEGYLWRITQEVEDGTEIIAWGRKGNHKMFRSGKIRRQVSWIDNEIKQIR